jgi:hypothetical protein
VAWEAEGPLFFVHHCHCSRCRKLHGTPFATYALARAKGFRWLAGSEGVARFEPWPGALRQFCGRCGSIVPGPLSEDVVGLALGGLDGDPGVRPEAHIFVGSKAPWERIADALPRHEAFPTGVDAPALPDPARRAPEPGALRGECLCGAVAFSARGPVQAIRNCHCSRCRKARAAAHATNMVLAADALRFERGAERLASYKLPEARFFTQVFCRDCGSKLPRVDPSRGIAVVPMGALDDDPGRGPDHHIFAGSKAPWFEIADDLPQHAELG